MNGFLKVSLPTFMTLMQRDCQISSAFNLKKVSLLYSCKKQQGPSFFYEAQLDSFQFSSSKLEIGQTSDWLESAESQMSELDSCNQKKSTGNIGFKKCCYQKTSTELPNSEWASQLTSSIISFFKTPLCYEYPFKTRYPILVVSHWKIPLRLWYQISMSKFSLRILI